MKIHPWISTLVFCFLISQGAWAQYVPKDKRKSKQDTVQSQDLPTEVENNAKKSKSKRPQNLSEQNFFQRLRFTPNFGFSFGNRTTVVELGPLVGYQFTDDFVAGIGGYYLYFRQRYDFLTNGGNIEQFTIDGSYYGGSVFGRYFIIPQGFVQVELENMNVEFFNQNDGAVERVWQFAPLVGGGYAQGGFFASFLYNLNHDSNTSWRGSPWVTRFGFTF